MPDFALVSPDVEYVLATSRIRILRPHVQAEFGVATGFRQISCFVDTGAPLSILSRGLIALLGAVPRPVSVPDPFARFVGGRPAGDVPAASLLSWEGVACELLEVDLILMNSAGHVTGPLTVLAKVPLTARPHYFNDLFAILGMHFLAANAATLILNTSPWGIAGTLTIP